MSFLSIYRPDCCQADDYGFAQGFPRCSFATISQRRFRPFRTSVSVLVPVTGDAVWCAVIALAVVVGEVRSHVVPFSLRLRDVAAIRCL